MRLHVHIVISLALLLVPSMTCRSQESPYILERKMFKVPLTSINISPDGMFMLAGFDDGSFRLLDPVTLETEVEVEEAHLKAVNAIAMPPKMDFLLTAGHNRIKLWDPAGNFLKEWKGHATTIWNVEISEDGKWAVSSAMNKTFLLWDVHEGAVKEQMRGHEDVTMAVCISPDNRFIASGSNDLTIKVWDLETRNVLFQLHGPTRDIYDLEFSPDGRYLAAASKDKSVRLYEVRERKLLHLLKGHQDMVMEAEFSPDGRYLATASADHSIVLWDVQSGEQIHQFLDNEGAVMDLVFHPDGASFYSISYGGDLTRWGLDPEIFVLKYFEGPYREELSSDPQFAPRQKGESKKDYQTRMEQAALKKDEIVDRYYQKYLGERDR